MTVETRGHIQEILNKHKRHWGTADSGIQKDVWNPTPPITVDDVIIEGTAHACRVIKTVLSRPDSPETTWRSYHLKNDAYLTFGKMIQDTGRYDLFKDWKKGEQRKRKEKTHWNIRTNMQVPQGVDKQRIEPGVRMPIYYICNTLRTLALVEHGRKLDIAKTSDQQKLYAVSPNDFRTCIEKAKDVDDLSIRFAVKTALILHSRGIDDQGIAEILTSCFASTGLIREYGQQKRAEKIVDGVLTGIIETGLLPGLAHKLRSKARSNVRLYYKGILNQSLLKSKTS